MSASTIDLRADASEANALGALRVHWVELLVAFLIIGYECFGKRFSHIGFAPLYIGELAFFLIMVMKFQALLGLWAASLTRSSALSTISWCMLVSVCYGLISFLRGVLGGNVTEVAVKNIVFHSYPLFFFVGFWVGQRNQQFLRTTIRCLAWLCGIYGVAYNFVFSPLGLGRVTGETSVPIFSHPFGAAVVLLGLLSFEPVLRNYWLPFLLNVVTLIGCQFRSAWLGFACAFPIWAFLTGRVASVFKLVVTLAVVLAMAFVTDVRIPSPGRRGGELSARGIIAQIVAPISDEWAAKFAPPSADVEGYSGTVSWRQRWWSAMWDHAHGTTERALIGPGYGYPIWDLNPEVIIQENLRTPHNVFMYALGYTGWVGVAVFYALQVALLCLMWRVFRQTGQPFGLCYWVLIMIWGLFDNFFNTPHGAIPFYLLLGLAGAAVCLESPRANTSEGH